MKEIPLTQGKVAIVDDEDYEYLRQFKWYAQWDGWNWYAKRNVIVNGKQKTILMHRVIMGVPNGRHTDHINHNGLDNREINLRICTAAGNQHNTGKQRNNTTGYKGVVITCGKYIKAQISNNGKRIHLGLFKTLEEAAKAYNEAAIKYHGEYAQLNEI